MEKVMSPNTKNGNSRRQAILAEEKAKMDRRKAFIASATKPNALEAEIFRQMGINPSKICMF